MSGRAATGENVPMPDTELLVIGAGPYAYAAAAYARDRGIGPASWAGRWASGATRCRPTCSCARAATGRSTPVGEHTFAAYFEERGLDPATHDPIPISVFLDHTDWFREQKRLDVEEVLVEPSSPPTTASPRRSTTARP